MTSAVSVGPTGSASACVAVHSDSLAFAEAVVERLEDLQDDVEVSRLMILPAEVVEVDAICYMSSPTLVELFRQVA